MWERGMRIFEPGQWRMSPKEISRLAENVYRFEFSERAARHGLEELAKIDAEFALEKCRSGQCLTIKNYKRIFGLEFYEGKIALLEREIARLRSFSSTEIDLSSLKTSSAKPTSSPLEEREEHEVILEMKASPAEPIFARIPLEKQVSIAKRYEHRSLDWLINRTVACGHYARKHPTSVTGQTMVDALVGWLHKAEEHTKSGAIDENGNPSAGRVVSKPNTIVASEKPALPAEVVPGSGMPNWSSECAELDADGQSRTIM